MASNESAGREPRLLYSRGLRGGPTWEYRGGLIVTAGAPFPSQHYLRLDGHPKDGWCFPTLAAAKSAIDDWLSGQGLD